MRPRNLSEVVGQTHILKPGSLLPRCHVPILFVNGTNDVHYVLDSYMKTFNVVPGEKQMRIQIKMPHGHPSGWAPQEIGLFIDSKCRGGTPLAVPEKVIVTNDRVRVPYQSAVPIKSAELHYTTDTEPGSSGAPVFNRTVGLRDTFAKAMNAKD